MSITNTKFDILNNTNLSANYANNYMFAAKVQTCLDGFYFVHTSNGILKAQRASSCLLKPAANDIVLAALVDENLWIISILQSADENKNTLLELPKNTTITNDESLNLQSPKITLQSYLLNLQGSFLFKQFDKIFTFANTFKEHIINKFSQYIKSKKIIADLEQKQVGRSKINVENNYRLRSKTADFHAQEILDFDAEHIKLG